MLFCSTQGFNHCPQCPSAPRELTGCCSNAYQPILLIAQGFTALKHKAEKLLGPNSAEVDSAATQQVSAGGRPGIQYGDG